MSNTKKDTKYEKKTCSFCGNKFGLDDIKEGVLVFTGNGCIYNQETGEKESVKICSKCIKQIEECYQDFYNKAKFNKKIMDYSPESIKEFLDTWIIGQESAKKIIATEVYNHLKRIKRLESDPDANKNLRIDKSNIILIGPSGSGKTEIIRALGEILDLPYVIENATTYTAAGYVGRDVEDILRDLMDKAKNDIEKAEKGIVFIDEFDKLKKEYTRTGTKDVGGEAVQQALLKLIEGAEFEIKKDKADKAGPGVKFDSTNVLFILGGAFEGISDIVQKRLSKETNIGFGSHIESKKKLKYNEISNKIVQADLKEFGIISEALGRCPVIACLNELTEEELIHILTKPKHAIIKQFTELLKLDNPDLEVEFTEEALKAIAQKAKENNIGARALRSILTEILTEPMYNIPKRKDIIKITIDKDLKCIYSYDTNNNYDNNASAIY